MKKLMIIGLLLLNYTICLKAPGRNSTDAGGGHSHSHKNSSSSSSHTSQHPTKYQAQSRVENQIPTCVKNQKQAPVPEYIGSKENNNNKCCTIS